MSTKSSHKKYRVRGMLALATAGLLILTGCNSSGEGGGGSANGTTMVVGIATEPDNINAAINTDQNGQIIGAAVYDALIEVDKAADIHPALAEEWEVSEDGLVYTFHLREGVKWHDGVPFTSKDVSFSLQNALPLNPSGSQIAALIDHIDTPDDLTAVVTLKSSFAPFLSSMRRMTAAILPAHIFEGSDIAANVASREPIGTGPFMYSSWKAGDSITLVKNPDYWGDEPELESLIFKITPDNTTRMNALSTGSLDYVMQYWVPYAQVATLEKNKELTLLSGRVMPTEEWLVFNTLSGPLAEEKVRQALYTAIDRELINDSVFNGAALVPKGIIPPGIAWAYNDDIDLSVKYAYDLDRANKLLDAAGYKKDANGQRFSLVYAFSDGNDPAQGPVGDILKAGWAQLGVTLDLVASDSPVWVEKIYTSHEFDVAMVQLTTRNDPALGISRVFMCNPDGRAYTNGSGFCDPKLDALWNAGASATTQEERVEAYDELQVQLSELLPSVPVIDLTGTDVINSRFANIEEFFDSAGHPELHWPKLTLK